jgi:hypothetical protein
MFAKNMFDRSSATDIQSISTVPSLKNGMPSSVSSICSFTLSCWLTFQPLVFLLAIFSKYFLFIIDYDEGYSGNRSCALN